MVALVKLQRSYRAGNEESQGKLYDGFMLLSRIEYKKNCIFFKSSKYMLLCKVVAMVILHQVQDTCQMWLNKRVIYDD